MVLDGVVYINIATVLYLVGCWYGMAYNTTDTKVIKRKVCLLVPVFRISMRRKPVFVASKFAIVPVQYLFCSVLLTDLYCI